MVGVLLISEGKAGDDMIKTVRRVLGRKKLKGFAALTIKSDLNQKSLKTKIAHQITKLKADKGVLLLTELYGSTQSNLCRQFLKKGQVELVTGFNLPMIIKAATLNEESSLGRVSKAVADAGQKYIRRFK